jgi:hypothetical protein
LIGTRWTSWSLIHAGIGLLVTSLRVVVATLGSTLRLLIGTRIHLVPADKRAQIIIRDTHLGSVVATNFTTFRLRRLTHRRRLLASAINTALPRRTTTLAALLLASAVLDGSGCGALALDADLVFFAAGSAAGGFASAALGRRSGAFVVATAGLASVAAFVSA